MNSKLINSKMKDSLPLSHDGDYNIDSSRRFLDKGTYAEYFGESNPKEFSQDVCKELRDIHVEANYSDFRNYFEDELVENGYSRTVAQNCDDGRDEYLESEYNIRKDNISKEVLLECMVAHD